MNETHWRTVTREARLSAIALTAAGDVFPTLLWTYRHYARAIFEVADLADQAKGDRLQQLAEDLIAMFEVLNEALLNRLDNGMAKHAARIGGTTSPRPSICQPRPTKPAR